MTCVSIASVITDRYSCITGEGSGNDGEESARTPLTEEEKLEQVKRSARAPSRHPRRPRL